jgi:hypothetical protein
MEHEDVGYARLLLGDVAAAKQALSRAETIAVEIPAAHEILERVRLIGRLVNEAGRERAIGQLDRWCDQTAGALGLRRLVQGDG